MSDVVAPAASLFRRSDEVRDALARGRPVVALESNVVAHGFRRPDNVAIAHEVERAVRAGGAVPATIAILDGRIVVGTDDHGIEDWVPQPMSRR
ncbi:pseudouridine-5'-phosphate glycosidase [Nocardia thraciensis]